MSGVPRHVTFPDSRLVSTCLHDSAGQCDEEVRTYVATSLVSYVVHSARPGSGCLRMGNAAGRMKTTKVVEEDRKSSGDSELGEYRSKSTSP